jgi:hypothetical protein
MPRGPQAMSASKDEALQERAFKSLLPKVDLIQGFFELSKTLQQDVCALLSFLDGKDLTQHQVGSGASQSTRIALCTNTMGLNDRHWSSSLPMRLISC